MCNGTDQTKYLNSWLLAVCQLDFNTSTYQTWANRGGKLLWINTRIWITWFIAGQRYTKECGMFSGKIRLLHLNTWYIWPWYEYQTSKSPIFRAIRNLEVGFSDPSSLLINCLVGLVKTRKFLSAWNQSLIKFFSES